MTDYSKGQIYKIVDNAQTKCYIGSTVQKLCYRMAGHRRDYEGYLTGKFKYYNSVFKLFDEYGVENCKIYWIENYPCNSKKELEAREGYYQQNTDCVNKVIAGRTLEQWYQDHRDERRAKNKENYQKKRETILEKQKQNYHSNRDEKNELNKARQRQKRIDYPEEVRKKDLETYYRHRETKLAKKKELVECECGETVSRGCLSKHKKTKKHQQYLQNQNNPQE